MNATSADVVVIGAGIVGAASAYRLAERGLRVLVLEQADSPATGSTARSAAGVRAQFTTVTNIELARHSIAEYASLPESGYRADGYLMLVPEDGWNAHLKGVALQRHLGVPTEVLSPERAQALVPFTPDGLGGCTYCAMDGFVDPHGLTHGYVRRARDLDARFQFSTPVTALERVGGAWIIRTPAGDVRAPLIVNATGAWAGEVGALAGLELPVRPARRMVFTTGPLRPTRHVPMTFDLHSGVWLRSEGERLIIGRADPADLGWRDGMNWDWLEPTLEAALARFPWLESASLDRRASWWGYYEVTPDHQPILGRCPGVEDWINACGFSGHGVMQAAAVARVVAQEALLETPFVNIDELRYERFSHGAPVVHDIQV